MKKMFMNCVVNALISLTITILLGIGIAYLWLPPMNFHSSSFWWFIFVMLICGAIISGITSSILNYIYSFSNKYHKYAEDKYIVTMIIIGIAIIWILAIFITSIGSWKMTKWENYYELIEIENGNFEEDIIDANSANDIVSVDVETARKLGDRTIGVIQNASWFDVDSEYNLISYNGEEYRLSPLKYGGFWKARKASENGGIPGYVLVNAKTQEATYVEKTGINYSPSAYFEYDLGRHLYNQYPQYIFGRSFFEIDDNGDT